MQAQQLETGWVGSTQCLAGSSPVHFSSLHSRVTWVFVDVLGDFLAFVGDVSTAAAAASLSSEDLSVEETV